MVQLNKYEGEVVKIVDEVLALMFSLAAESVPQREPVTDGYMASVSYVGQWRGALLVGCDHATARELAGRFLQTTVSSEDISDAMGELANMIGGNLKSALPPGVMLSVPSVAAGSALAVKVHGNRTVSSTSTFACQAGTFDVTLVNVLS